MPKLDPLIEQALALILAEIAGYEHGPVGSQNNPGATFHPYRAIVRFEFLNKQSGDVEIADPKYLEMNPPKLVIRPWIKDEDGVIIGEAHAVQKIKVDAGTVGAVLGVGSGGGAGLAVSLINQFLAKKSKG